MTNDETVIVCLAVMALAVGVWTLLRGRNNGRRPEPRNWEYPDQEDD